MDKLIQDILEWHKETFPKATLSSQLRKVESEIMEMYEAPNRYESLEEKADVCIALVSLAFRFNSLIGQILLSRYYYDHYPFEEIRVAMENKMKLNRTRTWKGNHHVDD